MELRNMGQQGQLGRYPLHFHGCFDQPFSIALRNVIRDTNQRGFVVHATNNLTIRENVLFNWTGHGYFLEDGIEINNQFIANLAVSVNLPTIVLQRSTNGTITLETDQSGASAFWISNPNNIFLQNSAVTNTRGIGYWYELKAFVSGLSASLPGAWQIIPFRTQFGVFEDNVAHSCRTGLTFYKNGYLPPTYFYIRRFYAWKITFVALQPFETAFAIVEDSILADAQINILLFSNLNVTIRNTIIMGYTENPGNPRMCNNAGVYYCVLEGGCPAGWANNILSIPANPSVGYRTVSPAYRNGPGTGLFLMGNTGLFFSMRKILGLLLRKMKLVLDHPLQGFQMDNVC
eukprot:jgi/Botrbrau1/18086/Bobra.0062s0071.2